ncbi:MAG: efflux RND transporter permease subunit [Firmicutes bacterium]|nr:efflux RND transporter permease subunit [Bacillota bacterium]
MKLSELAVNRPVTILMLVSIVVLLGAISLSRLSVDLYPDIKLPVAGVITTYGGAGPLEIEDQVTQPIEEILGTINNVKQIRSITRPGASVVIVEFNWGTNMDFATLQMREKVDLIKKYLPDEIETPMVIKMDPSMMPVLQMGISGGRDLAELQRLVEDDFKSRLERIDGVAQVAITGGLTREIKVLVDPIKLQSYGLSISQVAAILRSDNFNLSSGEVTDAKKQLFVRSLGQFQSIDEIKNLVISLPQGGQVFLRDIATVVDGYKDVTQLTRMNGQPSIGLHILKQSDANTVKVVEAVKREIDQIKREHPNQNIQINFVFDQSDYIKQSISTVERHAVVGAILAVVVLYLFLRNLRSTFIVALAIPLSIISTFILMYFAGLTLNLLSMGGLALGIGRMVDDAIVVLENIYRHRQQGYSLYEAARLGSAEVGNAVMASTFTTIAVFFPIVFVEGFSAILFKQLAMTVSFAIFSSLIVALTIVPMLASKSLTIETIPPGEARGFLQKANIWWGDKLEQLNQRYRVWLAWALEHRRRVIVITVVLLVVSVALTPFIGAEFLPAMDSGEISIEVQMPKGTVLAETNKVAEQIEGILKSVPEVKTVFVSVGPDGSQMISTGASQPDIARLQVMLTKKSERKRTDIAVADDIRQKVALIPGAEIKVSAVDPKTAGMPSSTPINIAIKGDDLDVLKDLAEQIAAIARQVEGTREIKTSLSEGQPEVQVIVNRQKASLYGITAAQVANTVQTAIEGQVATRYRSGGDEIDIRVRLADNARQSLQNLRDLTVASPMGMSVPLSELARLDLATGPNVINRESQVRVVNVTGYISGRDLNSIMKDIRARVDQLNLPPGYSVEYSGENKEMRESFSSLTLALLLAIILVYMVMAIQYESLVHPFVIMFSMPTAVIGIVLGLLLTGRAFSVPAFIGVIMLAGIVVSNAIVLVDYINTVRQRGVERNQAILEAGPVRLRPILMTALTTILAMLPLAFGFGEGGESQAPMATVVIGGLTVSTAITLVLVPVVYTIFDDLGLRIKNRLKRRLTGMPSVAQ